MLIFHLCGIHKQEAFNYFRRTVIIEATHSDFLIPAIEFVRLAVQEIKSAKNLDK